MAQRRRPWRHEWYLPLLLLVAASACNGDDPRPPVPISLQVDGPQLVTPPGQAQFTALQTWSDGSTVDVTASAQWASSNPSVLSVAGGLATALTAGEVRVTAAFERHFSQPRTVLAVPDSPEWNGTYTLTIGDGTCVSMPPELRQRTFTAAVTQNGLTLNVEVPDVGGFGGRIFNPEVRFFMTSVGRSVRSGVRLRRIAAASEPRIPLSRYARAAYSEPVGGPLLVEVLPDGNRLSIMGLVVTGMSPSGFTGTLNGSLRLLERDTEKQLAVCSSSFHPFTLLRR